MNLYERIFRAFDEAKIDYLVVGGVAVNLYGYNRFTGDIDIILALNMVNVSKMETLMHQMGYAERLPVTLQEIGEKNRWQELLNEKGMQAYTFISKTQPPLDIDIVVSESLSFSDYKKKKAVVEIWGLKLPLVSLDDLIGMKQRANRDKDKLDLEALLKLKEIE